MPTDGRYLTDEEVAERYRGTISIGTLRNWRAARIGPPYTKIGKAVLYPVEALDAWDKANTVVCGQSTSMIAANSNEKVSNDA